MARRGEIKPFEPGLRLLRVVVVAWVFSALSLALAAVAGQIEDSSGRTIDVPARVEIVFPAGPPAAIFLYMLAPDLMAGWPRPPHADECAFIPAPFADLPEIGRLTGRGGSANLETVLAIQPDLILDYGSVRETYISLADRVQDQTGIPYALVDGRFDLIPQAMRKVGRLIGRVDDIEPKAREAERIIAKLAEYTGGLSNADKVRVYYGRGADGL